MGGKDHSFDVVYRGESRDWISPGKYVFFQRLKEYGGGYWLGLAYDDCFVFAIERPISIREGMDFLSAIENLKTPKDGFHDDPDDFTLAG